MPRLSKLIEKRAVIVLLIFLITKKAMALDGIIPAGHKASPPAKSRWGCLRSIFSQRFEFFQKFFRGVNKNP